MKLALYLVASLFLAVQCIVVQGFAVHEHPNFLRDVSNYNARPDAYNIINGINPDNGVTLSASPSVINAGDDVTVSWTGVVNATDNDFVTISCGKTQGLDDFLDLVNVTNASESGSVLFPELIMMRCNYSFVYVNVQQNIAGNATLTALANTTVGMAQGFNVPRQGHLSLSDHPDEMWLVYVSGGHEHTPQVKYGTSPDNLDHFVKGTSETYGAEDMCNAPATLKGQQWFLDPGYIHSVLMTDLEPDTTYYYCYGNDDDGWSDMRSFLTPPPSGTVDARFIAYADMSTGNPQFSTVDMAIMDLEDGYNQFLLHFGDVSYARGTEYVWDQYFEVLEPLASRIPYMVSIGNHEYDHTGKNKTDPSGTPGAGWHPWWGNMGDDSDGECGVPMYYRFKTPSNGNGLFWYSFNYGGVHVIQMSTEHDWMPNSTQYQWLENDLASVDRTVTPWVILTGHRMMYTTQLQEQGDKIVSEYFQQLMEGLIYRYQVNLFLVGHQHSYERSCKVYNLTCTTDGTGTVHLIVGTAGAGLETGGFSSALGDWSLMHTENWGYLRMVATETELKGQFLLNLSGEIFDDFVILPWGQTDP